MIVVEGGIHAKFIDGGYVQANADIVVESEIINSTVKTPGSVIIPGGHEAVSQCHSEALAEESLIRNILISLDSSLRSE
jgi:uncharacterized protein (DUF342 family)